MKKLFAFVLVIAFIATTAQNASAEVSHRFGAGVHYWKTLDDINVDNVKESGFAYLVTYQLRPASLIKFGIDVEILPAEFGGSDKEVYAPQAYVLLGSTIYAALGAGTYYTDGEFSKDMFYNVRAGLDLCVLPFIYLDINANYRFENWDDIKTLKEDISSDTITIGAALRLEL